MAFTLAFKMAVNGNLAAYSRAVAIVNTSVIRQVTFGMKIQSRHAITRGGLGVRLPNALRSIVRDSTGADITKRGLDANPTGIVYSQATVRRQSGPVDLIGVFQTGTIVLPRKGSYLAVATREGGGRRAPAMSSYPANTFRVVKPKSGGGGTNSNKPALLAIHRVRKEIWYLLFREVRLRRRYNLDLIYQLFVASIPNRIAAAWQIQAAKLVGPQQAQALPAQQFQATGTSP